MKKICCQLVDERLDRGLVLRCALEAGHKGHHKPRGWRSASPTRKRVILNAEQIRDRLKTLMQGDDE